MAIRPAFRTDLLLIIALAFGMFGCAGISVSRSGGGGGSGGGPGGGSNPPPSVQLWSEILDPSRATDWTQAGIQGGISKRTTICRTVSLTAGSAAAAANATAIQNAIAACAGTSQVVMIPAGTWYTNGFYISGSPSPLAVYSNVTLRGAGANQTILLIQSVVPCYEHAAVCISGNNGIGRYNGGAAWTGDNGVTGSYHKGDTVIDLGTWTGTPPAVGDFIGLDQEDDSYSICPVSGGTGLCTNNHGATENGNTVTITTTVAHPYTIGQTVNVGGVSNPCPPNGCIGGKTSQWIGYPSSMTWSGGTVTVTFTNSIGINAGDVIWITGATPSGYNGVFTAAFVSGTTVTYALASNPGAYTSGALFYDPIQYLGQWTITDVGCNVAGTYASSASCGAHPINAFQYTDPIGGMAASGGGMASVDTGGMYITCIGGPTCSSEPGSGYPAFGRSCPFVNYGAGGTAICATGEYSYREELEVKRITAVKGSQYTIDPPIENANWRTSQAPAVFFPGTGSFAIGDSIENLTIDATNDNCGDYACGLIVLAEASNSWVSGVRTIHGNRNHVWIGGLSNHIDVVNNYFWGSPGATKSYGVEVSGEVSDNLVQNNICQHIVSCLILGGDSGSVYGYNYGIDSGYSPVDWNIAVISGNHDFVYYDLLEGNDVNTNSLDNIHGSSAAETNFRNRYVGQDTPARSNALLAVNDGAYNRIANFIGNVLGSPGVETNYQNTALFSSGYIYELGGQSNNAGTPNDLVSMQTLLRWGNYDVATGATRWCGTGSEAGCDGASEIPTTGVAFINGNAVPESHNLPPSFYLSAQPQFWTMASGYGPTPPWPAIGPDVSGGTAPDGVAGSSHAIPAQLCYINTPVDASYQRTLAVSAGTWGNGTGEGQATLTTSSSKLTVGDVVTISGVSPSGYNGIYQVISATSTSVTVFMPNDPGTFESGGIITYPNILNFNAANCYPNE